MGKVEALLASSMLGLVKEGIPAEFLVWDPAGCLVLCLRPFLLEGKGAHVEAPWMVDCLISWEGRVDGRRPGAQPEQTAATLQSDCTEPPLLAEAPRLPVLCIQNPVCQYSLLLIPRGALGKPVDKPNAKRWTFPFLFLSDCFNCSVVVLMDLRPWSGSCLSDFQLLFVNNLKRKKKESLHFGDKPV